MKRLITTILFVAVLSVVHFLPVWGYTPNIEIVRQMGEDMNRIEPIEIRYTTASLNIRSKPKKKSKIKGTLRYNEKVRVRVKDNKWWQLFDKDNQFLGYVNSNYLSKKQQKSRKYEIPEYSGMKSWMDYRKITDTTSPQYKLQQEYAETGTYGLRTVDGRYCVAIGYAFEPKIGQYFDLVLENGTVIPCIISDQKSHYDTTDDMFTTATDCCSEFVVDNESLSNKAHKRGDISDVNKDWDSPVVYIKIYTKKNVLEE